MILSLLLGLQSIAALAVCTDQRQAKVKDELVNSQAVVSANVIYSLDLREDANDAAGITATLYTLKVAETYKGNPPGLLRVRSENTSSRFPMEVGKSYLLFMNLDTAHRPRDYVVDQCGNSGQVEERQAAITQIMQLKADGGKTCLEKNPWKCYGTLEVEVSLVRAGLFFNTEMKFLSMLNQRFDDEISVSQMQFVFEDALPHERIPQSYMQLPRIQTSLYKNGTPAQLKSMLTDSLAALKVVVTAFPQGPDALSAREQTAIGEIESYYYPVGNKIDKVAVKVKKAGDGKIYIEYSGFGEPAGPYIVRATWDRNLLKPLPDDYSLQEWRSENGDKFTSLKDVRLRGSKN